MSRVLWFAAKMHPKRNFDSSVKPASERKKPFLSGPWFLFRDENSLRKPRALKKSADAFDPRRRAGPRPRPTEAQKQKNRGCVAESNNSFQNVGLKTFHATERLMGVSMLIVNYLTSDNLTDKKSNLAFIKTSTCSTIFSLRCRSESWESCVTMESESESTGGKTIIVPTQRQNWQLEFEPLTPASVDQCWGKDGQSTS